MSIDELGRAAAAEARRAAARQVNAATMLDELHHRRRTRTVGTIGVVVVVCAAIVVSVLLARSGKPTASPPAHTGEPHPTSTSGPGCQGGPPVESCSGRRVLVSLPVPVTIHAPANFDQNANICGSSGLESYRSDVNGTGVTVIEHAVPVRSDGSWHRDPSAGTSVASMAQWLSTRAFLTHTSVKHVTVDGRPGQRVSGELKPGARLPADKVGFGFVAPTFGSAGHCDAGYAHNLFGSYTLVDVPGAGVTVIWSWTIERNHALIDDNQAFIDGLRFG